MSVEAQSTFQTERTVDGKRLWFVWHGGAYIDVGLVGKGASEVINVWNDASDTPRIGRNEIEFRMKVDDWIAEYGPEALAHDTTHWH